MLVEFTIENFRCFKEKQKFSMVPTVNNSFAVDVDNKSIEKLLPVAGIYGANASGKSSFCMALDLFQLFIRFSFEKPDGGKIPYSPFKLDKKTQNAPTMFEIVFIYKGSLYIYGFSFDTERVCEEWMQMIPKGGRVNNLFSREYNSDKKKYEWYINDSIKGEKVSWRKNTRSDALFFSTAIALNAGDFNDSFKNAFEWIAKELFILQDNEMLHESLSARAYKNQTGFDERILSLLQIADIDVDDIKIEDREIPEDSFKGIPKEIKEIIKSRSSVSIEFGHKTLQGNTVYWDIDEESSGTKKLFSLGVCLLDALNDGGVLIIDELHNHFHPHIVQYIIGLFQNEKTNPKKAQLIFSSHDVLSMDPEYMGRDQIWLVDKKASEAKLVPLSSFKPREDSIYWRSYIAGKYGAVPNIKSEPI